MRPARGVVPRQSANGIGYAAATHAATGLLITPANPAQPGEYISLYLTGLGTVTPTVTDGVVGPSSPLSWSDIYNAGNLSVNFNDFTNGTAGNTGNIAFAGLAPTLAGLYQINVQIPTGNGLVSGDDVYVEFVGRTRAADIDQIQIRPGAYRGLDRAAHLVACAKGRADGEGGGVPRIARSAGKRTQHRAGSFIKAFRYWLSLPGDGPCGMEELHRTIRQSSRSLEIGLIRWARGQ